MGSDIQKEDDHVRVRFDSWDWSGDTSGPVAQAIDMVTRDAGCDRDDVSMRSIESGEESVTVLLEPA